MPSRTSTLSWVLVASLAALSACGSADDGGRPGSPSGSPGSTGERISVRSHCGVLGVTVAGRVWLAHPTLGDHNPPAGWDENQTPGSFVRTSETSATFTTDTGLKADFRLAKADTADPNDGCE
jgi:hypothetical protein